MKKAHGVGLWRSEVTLLLVALCAYSRNAQIIKGPNEVTVPAGGTAVLNCSVTCSAQGAIPVSWYMTLPTSKKNVAISPYTSLSQMKSFYGLDIKRSIFNDCPNGTYVAQLSLLNVTSDLNMMPVQCGALLVQSDCGCPDPQLFFSKFSILTVTR
ncbi:hypothetical protein EMCRGX_G015369 [Ephydatia muelleri]